MDPRDRVLNILAWLCYSPLSASTVVAASITRDQQGNVRFDSIRGGNSTEEGESSLATIEIHFPSLFSFDIARKSYLFDENKYKCVSMLRQHELDNVPPRPGQTFD